MGGAPLSSLHWFPGSSGMYSGSPIMSPRRKPSGGVTDRLVMMAGLPADLCWRRAIPPLLNNDRLLRTVNCWCAARCSCSYRGAGRTRTSFEILLLEYSPVRPSYPCLAVYVDEPYPQANVTLHVGHVAVPVEAEP